MPNAHVAAAATGLPGITIKHAEALSLRDALALRDGLSTLADVVGGLMCQARFHDTRHGSYNAPGLALEDLAEAVHDEMGRLVKVIRAITPRDSFEASERAEFLAAYEIENGGPLADALLALFTPPHA